MKYTVIKVKNVNYVEDRQFTQHDIQGKLKNDFNIKSFEGVYGKTNQKKSDLLGDEFNKVGFLQLTDKLPSRYLREHLSCLPTNLSNNKNYFIFIVRPENIKGTNEKVSEGGYDLKSIEDDLEKLNEVNSNTCDPVPKSYFFAKKFENVDVNLENEEFESFAKMELKTKKESDTSMLVYLFLAVLALLLYKKFRR